MQQLKMKVNLFFIPQAYHVFHERNDDKLGKLESSNTQTLQTRDVEAEAEAGSRSGGSGPFSVEAEAEAEVRKFYRFRFHIGYLT